MVNVKEYIEKLTLLVGCDDTEVAHSDADNILCCLLSELGYSEIIAVYKKVNKWYA